MKLTLDKDNGLAKIEPYLFADNTFSFHVFYNDFEKAHKTAYILRENGIETSYVNEGNVFTIRNLLAHGDFSNVKQWTVRKRNEKNENRKENIFPDLVQLEHNVVTCEYKSYQPSMLFYNLHEPTYEGVTK